MFKQYKCAECTAFLQNPQQPSTGACHRHAPRLHSTSGGRGSFPIVATDNFCLEFVPDDSWFPADSVNDIAEAITKTGARHED
jgi:hypothetical protein